MKNSSSRSSSLAGVVSRSSSSSIGEEFFQNLRDTSCSFKNEELHEQLEGNPRKSEYVSAFLLVSFLPILPILDREKSDSALQRVWFDGDRHWLLSQCCNRKPAVLGGAMRDPVSDWELVDLPPWLL